ncbi:MAG: hypothetical protein L0H53_01220 [Candidatus Nitrosocosmicus sp.]|nr:hypothetical protein [Candidatus Nitrosocosmicus sp.]MDN5866083.1 hypothetical protein [Candidatus Nitrosocosmicus sp.]
MQRSRLDKTIREMLVGHATGLDKVYYMASDEEIYSEYLKAIPNLQICADFSPISKKQEDQKKKDGLFELKQKYEKEISSLREVINNKFTRIFSLIQQNHMLAHVKPDVLSSRQSIC